MYKINGTEITIEKAFEVLEKIKDAAISWASDFDYSDTNFVHHVIEAMTDAHYLGNWEVQDADSD